MARVMMAVLKDDTELFEQFSDNESCSRRPTDMVFSMTYDTPAPWRVGPTVSPPGPCLRSPRSIRPAAAAPVGCRLGSGRSPRGGSVRDGAILQSLCRLRGSVGSESQWGRRFFSSPIVKDC